MRGLRSTGALFTLAILGLSPQAFAQGTDVPDVIVAYLDDLRQFHQPEGQGAETRVGLSAATTSCNIGRKNLNWLQLPDNQHPVIAINFYRLLDDRMEQLGQSWVKHGFFSVNDANCPQIPGVTLPTCDTSVPGQYLAPGCSDPYGAGLNANPAVLGPRSQINPSTGYFDGATALAPPGLPASTPAQKIMYMKRSDLGVAGARYFLEAHYITADDAKAGNARNNVTYHETKPNASGAWVFDTSVPEQRLEPAIKAWPGAKFTEVVGTEGGNKTHIVVASKAIPLSGGRTRYEYVVYNMNSDAAVGSFSVPAPGAIATSIGFKAVPTWGEPWSNAPWTSSVADGRLTWSTEKFAQNPKANAIRWGTAYNFWFESSGAPTDAQASVGRFKPLSEGAEPEAVAAIVTAPGN